MKRSLFFSWGCLSLGLIAGTSGGGPSPSGRVSQHFLHFQISDPIPLQGNDPLRQPINLPALRPQVQEKLGRLPLYFVENRGQLDQRVKYAAKLSNGVVFFTPEEIVFQFIRAGKEDTTLRRPPEAGMAQGSGRSPDQLFERSAATELQKLEQENVRIRFVGANTALRLESRDGTGAKFSYFRGTDPANWVANAPSFEKVVYRELYPNIDLIVSGKEGRLKNEYRVRPGGDPTRIALRYDGADRLALNGKGQLEVKTECGSLIEDLPVSYQDIDGRRIPVESRYVVDHEGIAGLEVGAYRKDQELIIDPLISSTFLGGNGDDSCEDIVQVGAGSIYITGSTNSSDFPTTVGATDTGWNGNVDVFVTRLNASGTSLIYSTYLGGSQADYGKGIALDRYRNAYVCGVTASSDFPTTSGAYDTAYDGSGESFVAKLDSSGSALVYSTFLDWPGPDRAFDLDTDDLGRVYVTGDLTKTVPPFDLDFYLKNLNEAGTGWIYWQKIASNDNDTGRGIVVDQRQAFVMGYTSSLNFLVTSGAFDTTYNGGLYDLFVEKLGTGGTLIFSTYLGGNNWDFCEDGIALDPSGDIVICGTTDSPDFPTTPAAFDRTSNGSYDAFIAKLDPRGRWLSYSTYVGGSSVDYGEDISIDIDGHPCLTGQTWSGDFPVTPNAYDASHNLSGDAFIAQANSHGSALLFSSYLGGAFEDKGLAVDASAENEIVVAGMTGSSGFPTTAGAFDTSLGGSSDGFVTRLSVSHSPQPPVRQTLTSGDFNGNGFNDLAVDFGPLGLWLWAGLGWAPLSGVNPKGLIVTDLDCNADNEIIGDFDYLGLWYWNDGGWWQLSGVNPEYLVSADFDGNAVPEIMTDFGALGVWLRSSGTWSNLSHVNPEWMVAANVDGTTAAEAVVDFGSSGVWLWSGGAWTKLASSDIDFMIAPNLDADPAREIVGDFGGLGLWLWDGTDWTQQLDPRNAEYLIAADTDNDGADELYVNFGADGLWSWNAGSWLQEAASYPWDMIPANIDGDAAAEIVVDFGPGIGLYNLDGSVWDLMTMAHAEFLLAADLNGDHIDEIIGDFGPLGLWFWLGGTWAQISGADPDSK